MFFFNLLETSFPHMFLLNKAAITDNYNLNKILQFFLINILFLIVITFFSLSSNVKFN